ncbi:hypothetical protein OIO90_002367 [Microbotryomycetes sp. JL221]|nr:hypothetical protein OIO90_002367 [Microbotryomycetes sp. JL221]
MASNPIKHDTQDTDMSQYIDMWDHEQDMSANDELGNFQTMADSSTNNNGAATDSFAFEMPNDFRLTHSPPPPGSQTVYNSVLGSFAEDLHDNNGLGGSAMSPFDMQSHAMSIDSLAFSGAHQASTSAQADVSHNSYDADHQQPVLSGISPASLLSMGASRERQDSPASTASSTHSSVTSQRVKQSSKTTGPSTSGSSKQRSVSRASPVVEVTIRAGSAGPSSSSNKVKSSSSNSATSKPKPVASTSNKTIATSSASKPVASSSSTSKSTPDTYEDQWNKCMTRMRETYFVPARFEKAATANAGKLIADLKLFQRNDNEDHSVWGDLSDVPPSGRHEVLVIMMKYGSEKFFKAWLATGSEAGMRVLYEWLIGAAKEARKGKGSSPLKVTIVPLLQVFEKLDLRIDHFKQYSKMGRLFKYFAEDLNYEHSPAKNIAKRLVERAQKLSDKAKQDAASTQTTVPDKNKDSTLNLKRKTEATEDAKKKIKTTTTIPTPVPYSTHSNDKTKLPSFRKDKQTTTTTTNNTTKSEKPGLNFGSVLAMLAPKSNVASTSTTPVVKTSSTNNVKTETQSNPVIAVVPSTPRTSVKSGIDDESVDSMLKPDTTIQLIDQTKVEPDVKNSTSTGIIKKSIIGGQGSKKVKKSVKWSDALVQYRYIEHRSETGKRIAERGGDNKYRHMMEAEEGDALSLDIVMEAEIEWSEPLPINFPTSQEWEAFHAPIDSNEIHVQQERVKNVMAVELTGETIPTSPEESLNESEQEEESKHSETKIIPLSQDLLNDPLIVSKIEKVKNGLKDDQVKVDTQDNQTINDLLLQLQNSGTLDKLGMSNQNLHQQQQPQQQPQQQQRQQQLNGIISQEALAQLATFDPITVQQVARQNGMSQQVDALQHGVNTFNRVDQWRLPGPDLYEGYVPPTVTQRNETSGTSKRQAKKKGRNAKCRFFNSPGGCERGSKCVFKHA